MQDPAQRPTVAELLQHDFLKAAARKPDAARRNLASLARRRQAITLQVSKRMSCSAAQQPCHLEHFVPHFGETATALQQRWPAGVACS